MAESESRERLDGPSAYVLRLGRGVQRIVTSLRTSDVPTRVPLPYQLQAAQRVNTSEPGRATRVAEPGHIGRHGCTRLVARKTPSLQSADAVSGQRGITHPTCSDGQYWGHDGAVSEASAILGGLVGGYKPAFMSPSNFGLALGLGDCPFRRGRSWGSGCHPATREHVTQLRQPTENKSAKRTCHRRKLLPSGYGRGRVMQEG